MGNLANFYSLLIFLIAIPFVLIVLLVWLTSFLGFTAWLFAGFAAICGLIGWRLYRRWGSFKTKMAAQGSEFQDLMREAAKSGKNVEISLLNGTFTLRYQGQDPLTAAALPGRPQPLALAGPSHPGGRGRRSARLAAAGAPPGGAGGLYPPAGRRGHQPRGIRPPQGQPAATSLGLKPDLMN